jgi:6-phosphofructokinase 2
MTLPRVVTLTFSPALDVATSVDVVTPSRKLRCEAPRQEPGGGGINVARVAQRLGVDAVAVAPLGGDRGQMVVEQLVAEGVSVEQIVVDHTIRQSFSVVEESTGHQYRFVLPPQRLAPADADRCVNAICDLGIDAGCVVISGSIDLPNIREVLRTIVDIVAPTPVLIDTSGSALDAALQSGAALVKPSARELADLAGRRLRTEDDITAAAVDTVQRSNVGALLVSIGSGGAVLVRPGAQPVRFRAPTVEVRSTVGAGDSLVAGIASGMAAGDSLTDSICLGIAAGTATVMTDGTELCDPAAVHELLPLVVLDERDDRRHEPVGTDNTPGR